MAIRASRKMRSALGVALAGGLALSLAGCGSSPSSAQASSTGPYIIGVSLPLTGPYDSLGVPEMNSIDLAVQQINAGGGVNGRKLKVISFDNATDPTKAGQEFKQLVQDNPIGLIGDASTGGTMVAVPIANQAKIPLISLASDAEIIQPVAQRQWIFKVPIVDTTVMQVMVNYFKAHGISKVAFVYGDFEYGTGGLSDFQKYATPQGIQLVGSVPVSMTATDATPDLAKLSSMSPAPQAVVVWDVPPGSDIIAKGYASLGDKWPIFFSDGSSNDVFLTLAGSAVNGDFVVSTKLFVANQLPASDPQKSVIEKYVSSYDQAYGSTSAGPANMFGAFGYDAVYMLKDAIAIAGKNATPATVRTALEHLNYNGVTGVMHLTPQDHNGLDPDSEILMQVVNQHWTLVPGFTGAKE